MGPEVFRTRPRIFRTRYRVHGADFQPSIDGCPTDYLVWSTTYPRTPRGTWVPKEIQLLGTPGIPTSMPRSVRTYGVHPTSYPVRLATFEEPTIQTLPRTVNQKLALVLFGGFDQASELHPPICNTSYRLHFLPSSTTSHQQDFLSRSIGPHLECGTIHPAL